MTLRVPLLLAALLAAATARAATPVAIISDADGDVDVVRVGGKIVDGIEDLQLFQGDQVKTALKSYATISFVDKHLLKLGEKTTLTIRAVTTTTKPVGFLGQVRLLTGKVFASFGTLAGSGFRVETATAVAAVKGTTFSVETGETDSTVSVLEGTVATSGVDAQGNATEAVDVPEGQEASVSRGERKPRALRAFLKDQRRAEMRERLAEIREHAREHRQLGASGGLDKLRRLRTLAREGRLDQADPELKKFLEANPRLKARVERHAERHRRLEDRRRQRQERRDAAEERRDDARERRDAAREAPPKPGKR